MDKLLPSMRTEGSLLPICLKREPSAAFLMKTDPVPCTMGSLNVNERVVFVGTADAPFAGENDRRAGCSVSLGFTSMLKSSTASPSSAPDAFASTQRIMKVDPAAIFKPVRV